MKSISIGKVKKKKIKVTRNRSIKVTNKSYSTVPVITVRRQVDKLKDNTKEEIIATLELDLLGQVDLNLNEDSEEIMWQLAELYASNELNRKSELIIPDNYSSEFVTMVKICRDSLSLGRKIERPFEIMDYYWNRPKELDFQFESVERRNFITEKIGSYIKALIKHNTEKDIEVDMMSNSYRTVLWARKLTYAIEEYATIWTIRNSFDSEDEYNLKENYFLENCKQCAFQYMKAHTPINDYESVRGSQELIDPDYFTYRRLLNVWGLNDGTILHEFFRARESA